MTDKYHDLARTRAEMAEQDRLEEEQSGGAAAAASSSAKERRKLKHQDRERRRDAGEDVSDTSSEDEDEEAEEQEDKKQDSKDAAEKRGVFTGAASTLGGASHEVAEPVPPPSARTFGSGRVGSGTTATGSVMRRKPVADPMARLFHEKQGTSGAGAQQAKERGVPR